MNKTIIININGLVFHIEEEAYEALRQYMIDVKKHFAYTADSAEIVNDIENRIAEMFNERIIAGKKEVITVQDVDEICAQIGKVSDFENEEAAGYHTEGGEQGYSGARKLFRDTDSKMLGGVCSGLGYYFDIEVIWVRLAMALLFVFAGTGFLLYLILWIVVPEAKTRADRMAMRGEAPNLQNFKKNLEEELEGLRGNFSKAGESIKPGLNKLGDTVEQFGSFLGKLLTLLVKAVGILVLFTLCLSLISLLIGVMILLFWGGHGTIGPEELYLLVGHHYIQEGLLAALLVVGIPLVALISVAIKLLFKRQVFGNYMAFALLVIWLTSVGFVTFYGVKTAEDFSEEATVVKEQVLTPYPTYNLKIRDVNQVRWLKEDSVGHVLEQDNRWQEKANYKSDRRINIEIQKASVNETAKIILEQHANGKDFELAAKRAGNIIYHLNQEQGTLIFDNYSFIQKGELLRDQQVNIKLVLPVGVKVQIPKEAERYIWNIPVSQCREEEDEHNEDTLWAMAEDGLHCLPTDSLQQMLPTIKK